MKKHIMKLLAIFTVLAVFNIPTAMAAEFVYTALRFTTPSDVSFAVKVVGASAYNTSTGTSPGNFTEQLDFNATDANSKLVSPCRFASADCQIIGTTPALSFRNDGNQQINITASITNSSGRMGVTNNYQIQVNLTNGSADTPAYVVLLANETEIGCTPVNNATLVGWLPPNNITHVWLFANFTSAPGGSITEYGNWTSVGNETGA